MKAFVGVRDRDQKQSFETGQVNNTNIAFGLNKVF